MSERYEVVYVTKKHVKKARKWLRERGLPVKCERCGEGPGGLSCGKIIHIEMDRAWEETK